jgi:hypothetical protein
MIHNALLLSFTEQATNLGDNLWFCVRIPCTCCRLDPALGRPETTGRSAGRRGRCLSHLRRRQRLLLPQIPHRRRIHDGHASLRGRCCRCCRCSTLFAFGDRQGLLPLHPRCAGNVKAWLPPCCCCCCCCCCVGCCDWKPPNPETQLPCVGFPRACCCCINLTMCGGMMPRWSKTSASLGCWGAAGLEVDATGVLPGCLIGVAPCCPGGGPGGRGGWTIPPTRGSGGTGAASPIATTSPTATTLPAPAACARLFLSSATSRPMASSISALMCTRRASKSNSAMMNKSN